MAKKKIIQLVWVIVATVLCAQVYSTAAMQTQQETANCTGADLQVFQGVKLSEKLYGLPGINNVGRVSPCVYRGRQPESEGYQTLRKMGVKTIINLRAAHGERKAVENADMKYLEFPLSMKYGIRREKLQEIVNAMADPVNQPVYIHCALGQDRTGVVVASYRMYVDGWSFEDAEKEMQSFGFNDTWIHLKKSLLSYAKHNGKVPRR